ncbi:mitochondrial thioredoxin [Colletotrichum scovillei]|uniref:Mitochondrial thioredoxin n=1 Tax=Colletotrichum scovillei TaxID=1209932 RepID=A0A9P7QSX6_9PEZI|nr:mitochondrial thioredoxin [Colletotrichum scovillei]KAG7040867.1 mitochondrial thioredoxin [Colletotrichum scovillei]KAG7060911.1 mitochondrial thioredoxin [Colletotrichum scovillei]
MQLLRHTARTAFRGCNTNLTNGVRMPPPKQFISAAAAHFSTSRTSPAKNQIYASVRRPDDFHTYQLLSSSSHTPLITLWTTSWCGTCRVVAPLIQSIVESGVGEAEGGVGYCTVEFDSPDVMSGGLGMTYMITSIPTLLSFDNQEAQIQTKVHDAKKLTDRAFLEEWIRSEARRHGQRGGGGGSGGVFGGLFGGFK